MRRPRFWLARAAAVLTAAALVFGAAGSAEAAKKKPRRMKKAAAKAEPPPVPRPPDPNRVTITTPDGVALAATWRPLASQPNAPAVLLVHDFARERRALAGVAEELSARGLATLAIELRAHGESTQKGKTRLKLSPRMLSNPNAFPVDVETACRWLRTRSRSVGVLGLSLGANLAVLATANGWADAAVAVSASAARLAPLAGARSRSARATLFLASEKDTDRAKSAQSLDASAKEPRKVLILPGAAHAMSLLQDPRAKKPAYDWLVERLGVTPPTPTPTPVFVPVESTGFAATPAQAAGEVGTPAPTVPPTTTPLAPAAAPTPEGSPFGEVVPPSPPPAQSATPTPPRSQASIGAQARRTSSAAGEAGPQRRASRA